MTEKHILDKFGLIYKYHYFPSSGHVAIYITDTEFYELYDDKSVYFYSKGNTTKVKDYNIVVEKNLLFIDNIFFPDATEVFRLLFSK